MSTTPTPKPNRKPRSHFNNWISAIGGVLTVGALFSFLFLVWMDFTQGERNPYLGILTYIVAPIFLKRPGDLAAADQAEREMLPPLLDYLEGQVPDAGGFLVEDRITLADLAVASPFANLTRPLGIDISSHPRTRAWLDAIPARPSLGDWVEKEARFFEKVRAAA